MVPEELLPANHVPALITFRVTAAEQARGDPERLMSQAFITLLFRKWILGTTAAASPARARAGLHR